ncbi:MULTISPECIES: zinc transporter ZupT [unclassified Luteococcus]|uniref:zinc transporter ZupT n=1 Tax=unclassified Luteococcus TaxID=2639923 RepID=UPI00313D827F
MALALLISLLAGLATSVGGALALRHRSPQREYLAVALAFAAGAMLLISLVQIVPLGIDYLRQGGASERVSLLVVWVAFFAGIGVVLGIDRLLPAALNPNEREGADDLFDERTAPATRRVMRSGLLTAVVLGLHNFPEGMATFFTTYQDQQVGLTLAAAVAIHNVPEGIAVAAPIYAATRSRRRAFTWATVSGLTEPVGGLLAAALVSFVVPPTFFGVFYGGVAGMMVFLALDELLPGSWRYQTDKHQTIYGMLAGMAVMVASFILFAG